MNNLSGQPVVSKEMKEIRREQKVAACIFAIAVVFLIYAVTVRFFLPEGVESIGYTVTGYIMSTLFGLVAVHHYCIGVWAPKRKLRRS